MSCSGWKEYMLEEAIAVFIDYRGKTPKKVSHGIPLITAKIVKNGIIEESKEFIKTDDYDAWMTRGIPLKGDVVMTTEAPLGEVAQINTENKVALAQRIITMRGDKKVLDNTFLKYSLQSPIMQCRLKERASGTTVTGIKSSELKKVVIKLPNIKEQKTIASILCSLDNKIELNNEMNKTLEEMAQALFKRWFVDFEFPNDEGEPYKSSGGEMVESELGMIPKGWGIYNVTELVDSVSIKHKFDKDKVIFLNTSDVLDGEVIHNNYSEVDSLPGQAKKSVKKNDILYSEIRPKNKRYAFIDFDCEDYVVSTKLMVLRVKSVLPSILMYKYLTSNETIEYLQSIAESRSGTFPQITYKELEKLKLALPNKEIILKCNDIVEALFNQVQENKRENKLLIELRDSLLPKLMSGEIRVEEIEANL